MRFKYYFIISIFLLSSLSTFFVKAIPVAPNQTFECLPARDCEVFQKYIGYRIPQFCDLHNEKILCPVQKIYTPPVLTSPWVTACNEYAKIKNTSEVRTYILNGQESRPHEFPFMALIGTKNEDVTGIKWQCGGILITPSWVLTAAHCFDDGMDCTSLVVRLGEHDYSTNESVTQDFEKVTCVTNSAYKGEKNHRNDIALINLNRNAILSVNVLPACLSITSTTNYESFTTAGWGLTNLKVSSTKLLKAELYPLNCAEHMISKEEDINQICAINDKLEQNTCEGDSGGPLFVKHPTIEGLHEVVGITSSGFGDTCFDKDEDTNKLYPGLYTRISAHMNWIKTHIREHEILLVTSPTKVFNATNTNTTLVESPSKDKP